jgi:hypothetical protein
MFCKNCQVLLQPAIMENLRPCKLPILSLYELLQRDFRKIATNQLVAVHASAGFAADYTDGEG